MAIAWLMNERAAQDEAGRQTELCYARFPITWPLKFSGEPQLDFEQWKEIIKSVVQQSHCQWFAY